MTYVNEIKDDEIKDDKIDNNEFAGNENKLEINKLEMNKFETIDIEANELKDGKDLSLYLHIPFCAKKCDYCDFLSSPMDATTMKQYMEALIKEIKTYTGYKDYSIKTIFIGGGTPSLIEGRIMKEVLIALKETFHIHKDAEISIEINPGTISKDKLIAYKEAGINRLSFGLQSVHNRELKLLGRIHSYEQFKENFLLAKELGFTNINVDLMSGLPFQNLNDWIGSLEEVTSLNPSHISAYSLIVEEDTPFYARYTEEDLDENLDRDIYDVTKKFLEKCGYHQYEISNYAKEGYECKHNIIYWTRKEYLGIGLGSASFINNVRYSNEKDIKSYIDLINQKKDIKRDVITLTEKNQMEEFVFLGLRMKQGIRINEFKKIFGLSILDVYDEVINRTIEEGLLMMKEDKLCLTDKGIDLSNLVMSRFLID